MDELSNLLANDDATAALPVGVEPEQSLFVSKKVLDGQAVLFVFRDEPESTDSGWVLLTGTEPDSWLDDMDKFEERTVAWALEHDPTLRGILAAPADSSFERDTVGADWAELVDG
ncbi:MAG: DUF2185 domain-containing protein [Deltaproteobacteria bacterium]|nr:DUF2185 domain-containing protein [Deltaproteobacteria bacterium]